MKISNVKKSGNRLNFTLSGISTQYANALRRSIIAEVPIMAVEEVDLYYNSSIINDEVLAHRIGLMPLTTDIKTYNLQSECSCKGKGCAKCSVTLTLDVEGPKTVYASDFKSKDPKIKPVYAKMVLAKIMAGQKIKIEVRARLGTGSDHIKWQGGLASYDEVGKETYDFMIETYGQLPLNELVSAAFQSFEDKLEELKSIK